MGSEAGSLAQGRGAAGALLVRERGAVIGCRGGVLRLGVLLGLDVGSLLRIGIGGMRVLAGRGPGLGLGHHHSPWAVPVVITPAALPSGEPGTGRA